MSVGRPRRPGVEEGKTTSEVTQPGIGAAVRTPSRWRDGRNQIVVGLVVFGGYLGVTHGLPISQPAADAHGQALLDADRWLHLDVVRPLNTALAGHEMLGLLAAWEYALTYIVTTFGLLGWLWWRADPTYRWARNTLIISTVLAIACFALWPATPPRLLPDANAVHPFVDIVAQHSPPLSWGGGAVSAGADQYAAMPSLHIGWAVWVTVAAARAGARRLDRRRRRASRWIGIGLAALHLAVTALVVLATANHYFVDILAGFALVAVACGLEGARAAAERRWHARSRQDGGDGQRRMQSVAAEDAFFFAVESAAVPQQVGGIALLDVSGHDENWPRLEDVRAMIAERLPRLPRLRQRVEPAGWLRRARWVNEDAVDVDWHVRDLRLDAPGGRAALHEFVGRLASVPLERTRPMWRLFVVRGVGPDEAAVVVVMHHAIADGLGVVDMLRHILDPQLPAVPALPPRRPLVRLAAVLTGLVQLARDGKATATPFTGPLSPARRFRTAALPLADVRRLAREHGVRVTDLLLTLTGEAVATLLAERGETAAGPLRVAVPVTLRAPAPPGTGRRAVPGNLTGALRLDVPLDDRLLSDRLAEVAVDAERRRRSGRALASRAVMHGLGVLPPPWAAWSARAIYRSAFFTAIASNMPGPTEQLSFAQAPLLDVYPLLPLAEGVPLAVGTLGWGKLLCLSIVTDPSRLPEADRLIELVVDGFERLRDQTLASYPSDRVDTGDGADGAVDEGAALPDSSVSPAAAAAQPRG